MLPAELIDGLKLIAEKLDEAVADRNSQRGAIVEAAGAVPAVRDYIKAKDMRHRGYDARLRATHV